VIKEGWLNCTHSKNSTDSLLAGRIMHIDSSDSCGNDVIQIHRWHGRHVRLIIDLSTDGTVDEHIVQKALANSSRIEDIQKVRQRHQQAQTQLHKHILTAQQEMQELMEWADKAQQQWGTTPWT
jgi:hypothetical protein